MGDTSSMIKKQAEALQQLMKENEMLQTELSNTYKSRSAKQNIQHSNSISQLTDQTDLLERRIQAEETRLTEFTTEIANTKEAIMRARKGMGGINITKDNTMMVDKQVKVLEKRLDQALIKFNEALSENKELREQIDNLRRERVVFDGIYKKLERELHEKKKQMADIIEQSNLYYEERDIAVNELAALKVAAEKDMVQYEDHFKELDLMIEADKQLREQLKQIPKVKAAPAAKKEVPADLEEEKMRKTLTKPPVLQPEENIEEIMEQLMDGTQIHDLGELLERFVQAEEQNFSMYNFVNDLHNEVEALEEAIGHLQAEYGKHKGTAGDVSRQQTLRELEEQLARTERTSEEYVDRTGKAEEIIHELRVGMDAIFSKLGCNLDEMNEVLGTTQCTESNITTFLGIVEQRTTELLAQYNTQLALHERHKEKSLTDDQDDDLPELSPKIRFMGQGPSVPFGQNQLVHLVTALPSTGDNLGGDADDAEDDRVLTHEELRSQTEMRLAIKEEQKALGAAKKKARTMRKKTLFE